MLISLEIQVYITLVVLLYLYVLLKFNDVTTAILNIFGKVLNTMTTHFKQKIYVKLMADYCSTGLWDIDGCNIDYQELPLTQALINDIKTWQSNYDLNNLDWMVKPTGVFDIDEHEETGKKLAKRIRKELGNSGIVEYFSEKYLKVVPF